MRGFYFSIVVVLLLGAMPISAQNAIRPAHVCVVNRGVSFHNKEADAQTGRALIIERLNATKMPVLAVAEDEDIYGRLSPKAYRTCDYVLYVTVPRVFSSVPVEPVPTHTADFNGMPTLSLDPLWRFRQSQEPLDQVSATFCLFRIRDTRPLVAKELNRLQQTGGKPTKDSVGWFASEIAKRAGGALKRDLRPQTP
jgi:hypothetical protein